MHVSSGLPHVPTSNHRGRGQEPVTVLGKMTSFVSVNAMRPLAIYRANVNAYNESPAPITTNCRPSSMNVIGAFDGVAWSPACQSGSPVDGSYATKFAEP